MTNELSSSLIAYHPTLGQVLGGDSASAPTTPSTGTPAGAPAGQAPAGGSNIFFLAMVMMVGMFLIMSLSGRKEKKKRAAMLSTLDKRDKVRTAGGIIGTIIEVKDDEVLIETDRSSHTRLWLARGSVSTVIDSSKRSKNDTKNDSVTEAVTETETVNS